ncbi:ABC transporter permease [Halorussus salinisoli]|uniref:ABC transporter permease n=1 Tax=Halorussus salinisoli TaxID=2558242 RepID=UPI001484D814|nr:ABC transporter permease [Halorussus salinisoli]
MGSPEQPIENRGHTAEGSMSKIIQQLEDSPAGKYGLLGPSLLIIGLFLVVPSLLLLRLSVSPFAGGSIGAGFTLEHYVRTLTEYQSTIFRTVKIALIVTVIDFLIGYPLAYAAVRGGKWQGRLIVVATLAPLSVDVVVRTFGWFLLLQDGGLVPLILSFVFPEDAIPSLMYNELGIIIGLTHVLLPFMVFPLINILHTIPPSLEEAGRDLGASQVGVFRKVLLPLSLPGIAAGTLMVFSIAMASYVTPSLLGGTNRVMATTITNTFLNSANWPFGSAMAVFLLLVGLLVIFGYQWSLNKIDSSSGGL